MKLKLILLVLISSFSTNCRRDGIGCWQAFDPQSYGDAPGLVLCDKSKMEAESAYLQFWFYKAGEKKYCWKVPSGSGESYLWGIPKSIAEKYRQERGIHFTEVDCNSFCGLEWSEKHKSKVTNQLGPTRIFTEIILLADSCSKISVGRVVVIRETADSLITRELMKKVP